MKAQKKWGNLTLLLTKANAKSGGGNGYIFFNLSDAENVYLII